MRTTITCFLLCLGILLAGAGRGQAAPNQPAQPTTSVETVTYYPTPSGVNKTLAVTDQASLAINPSAKVGIGTLTPTQKLDVDGAIHASGDICSDAAGGKCLGTVTGFSNIVTYANIPEAAAVSSSCQCH